MHEIYRRAEKSPQNNIPKEPRSVRMLNAFGRRVTAIDAPIHRTTNAIANQIERKIRLQREDIAPLPYVLGSAAGIVLGPGETNPKEAISKIIVGTLAILGYALIKNSAPKWVDELMVMLRKYMTITSLPHLAAGAILSIVYLDPVVVGACLGYAGLCLSIHLLTTKKGRQTMLDEMQGRNKGNE